MVGERTLVSSSSLVNLDSTSPPQSLHVLNFSCSRHAELAGTRKDGRECSGVSASKPCMHAGTHNDVGQQPCR